MRWQRWFATLVLLLAVAVPACAAAMDGKPPDPQSIAALQARISQAPAKEQCFLYAELIHEMTEYSLHEYAAGNVERASALLQQVQQMAHKLHAAVSENDKRLKNAELLLRHTAFRLTEMVHSMSYEDRPVAEEALNQVNAADQKAMMQVFQK